MAYTGGELNKLNGMMGISSVENSVPIMKLIDNHKPKSEGELVKLIEHHVGGADCCDVVSRGTIQDFGRELYDAQEEMWGEKRYSLEECIIWEYDLFIVQSMKGNTMESKAIDELRDRLTFCNAEVTRAGTTIDSEYRIDLIVKQGEIIISGIQVKPTSYNTARDEVKLRHEQSNQMFKQEVLYLYYEYETEEFTNIDGVVEELIHKLV